MHTLLMVLLAAVALAVACFDARELFMIWYSVASPSISTRDLLLAIFELTFCISLVGVVSARLYFNN